MATSASGAVDPNALSNQQVQEEFKSFDPRTHVEKKGMWAGLTHRAHIPNLCGAFPAPIKEVVQDPESGETREVETKKMTVLAIPHDHTPAMLKAFDEYLVNASDHAVGMAVKNKGSRKAGALVTAIDVTYTPDGVFIVRNDGPGIPVQVHREVSAKEGRPIYIPELAFCSMFSGSNMVKASDSIKGGINGVGAKIGNIHSVQFRTTTVGVSETGALLYYTQRCQNRMTIIEPPTVFDVRKPPADIVDMLNIGEHDLRPHTQVKMMPAYASLGYDIKSADWQLLYAEILGWLRLRCCQLAAYVGPKVKVTLNGVHVTTSDLPSLAALYMRTKVGGAPYQVLEATMKPKEEPYKTHPWRVLLVLTPAIRQFEHHSIINGVVTMSGPHITRVKEQLKDCSLKKIASAVGEKDLKLTTTDVCKHSMLFVVGALPGADWSGQRKDNLDVSSAVLANYNFTAAFLKDAAQALCSMYLQHAAGKTRKSKAGVKVEKYTKARNSGARRGGPVAHLMVAEGDSAITLLRAGLTLGEKKNPGGPTFQNYGVFSLGGVPMNAAKQVTDLSEALDAVSDTDSASTAASASSTGRQLVRKKKLKDNKTLCMLEQIIGLDHNCTYAETPAGDAEFRKLRYRSLIACVDQDVDGAGKILGLLLTYFNLFWPSLLRRGFVRWFMTPIIRAYPHAANTAALRKKMGAVAEFQHEQLFAAWVQQQGGMDVVSAKYRVFYFKGLGGHDKFEHPNMFRDFERKVYTFYLDDEAPRLFEVYYGKDTAPRKVVLSTPMADMSADLIQSMDTTRRVPCSVQLEHFSKAYKLDAMTRQLPGALDGFTVGRRKGIDGARKRFANGGECMTFQLAGYVADKELYHHGGSSMEGALISLCQTFPGSRNVPLLIGTGDFGSRRMGGSDAASPRYTRVSLNRKLVNCVLPPEDDFLLPYSFVDGERAEPQSYVPIVPLVILDNMEIPSEGWNYCSWARRASQVVEILRAVCDPRHPEHELVSAVLGLKERAAGQAVPQVSQETYARLKQTFPLDPSLRAIGGRLATRKGAVNHFGTYQVLTAPGDPDGERGCVVRVTELPLRVWSAKYAEKFATRADGSPNARAKYVDNVDDYSNDEECNINIQLKPGMLAQIRQDYARSADLNKADDEDTGDPMIEFLKLRVPLNSRLNVIRPHPHGGGGVIEFGDDYHAVLLYYVPIRVRYYRLRFERRRVLLELRIRMEEETLRYIKSSSDGTLPKISTIENVAVAASMLAQNKFPLINKARITSPKFETVEELRALIVEVGESAQPTPGDSDDADGASSPAAADESAHTTATYNYILNLKERELLQSSRLKREAKVEQMKIDLAEVDRILGEAPFAAASVWLEELSKFEAILTEQGFYT